MQEFMRELGVHLARSARALRIQMLRAFRLAHLGCLEAWRIGGHEGLESLSRERFVKLNREGGNKSEGNLSSTCFFLVDSCFKN